MTYQQLSRFQIRSSTELIAPGKCAVCGSISGSFVDFGLELDFYGVVYLCFDNCFKEACSQLDYFPVGELSKRDVLIAQFDSVNSQLEMENQELRNALGIVDRVRSNGVDPGQLELSLDEDSSEDERDSAEDDSGTDEPTNESGSSDILSNDILKQLSDI